MIKLTFTTTFLLFVLLTFAQTKKVLIVSTNVDSVGNDASGTYLMEIAFPFHYFITQGIEVDIVTPKGGKAAIYGKVTDELLPISSSELFIKKTAHTLSPEQIKPADYSAVFYPGGHGQYFDVMNEERIASLTASIYENGGAIGTAGHGAASLANIRLSNCTYLVAGKTITCFPWWAEKKFMNISGFGKFLPFDQQEVLLRRGANLVVCSPETRPDKKFTHITDSKNRMVTGAFASSAQWVAEQVYAMMIRK